MNRRYIFLGCLQPESTAGTHVLKMDGFSTMPVAVQVEFRKGGQLC